MLYLGCDVRYIMLCWCYMLCFVIVVRSTHRIFVFRAYILAHAQYVSPSWKITGKFGVADVM